MCNQTATKRGHTWNLRRTETLKYQTLVEITAVRRNPTVVWNLADIFFHFPPHSRTHPKPLSPTTPPLSLSLSPLPSDHRRPFFSPRAPLLSSSVHHRRPPPSSLFSPLRRLVADAARAPLLLLHARRRSPDPPVRTTPPRLDPRRVTPSPDRPPLSSFLFARAVVCRSLVLPTLFFFCLFLSLCPLSVFLSSAFLSLYILTRTHPLPPHVPSPPSLGRTQGISTGVRSDGTVGEFGKKSSSLRVALVEKLYCMDRHDTPGNFRFWWTCGSPIGCVSWFGVDNPCQEHSLLGVAKSTRNELSRELVIEILLRLPARSVVRFCRVSKWWHNIIGEESFRDLHRRRSPPDPSILFLSTQFIGGTDGHDQQPHVVMSRPASTRHLVIKLDGNRYQCHDIHYRPSMACDGLICIAPISSEIHNFTSPSIMVCNPLTLEYVVLPPVTSLGIYRCTTALGFAPVAKEYKVVCIAVTCDLDSPPIEGRTRGEIKVCTLAADRTWRVVEPNVDFEPHSRRAPPIHVEGKMYWLIFGALLGRCKLLSFDVEEEKAAVIRCALPPLDHDVQLAKLGSGGVALLVNHGSAILAWVLAEDGHRGHRWELKHRIDPNPAPQRLMLGTCQLGDGTLLILLEGAVVRYDGRAASVIWQKAAGGDPYSLRENWLLCRGYNPSLVSLKKYGSRALETVCDENQGLLPPPNMHLGVD